MSSPAVNIIAKCGGAKAVAELLQIDIASVYKWTYPSSKGGTNGLIPSARQRDLLEKARAANIDLTPDDFFAATADIPHPETAGAGQ
jgi:amino-acid N-acetyltransferase